VGGGGWSEKTLRAQKRKLLVQTGRGGGIPGKVPTSILRERIEIEEDGKLRGGGEGNIPSKEPGISNLIIGLKGGDLFHWSQKKGKRGLTTPL